MTIAVKRLDDLIERAWLSLAKRDGRFVAAGALLLYAVGGLGLPLLLRWSTAWLVSANVTCTMLAGCLVLVWFGAQVQARDRRHLVEWTTDLRLLDSAEFEWLVGELFRREGWTVEETGRREGPDGNVDLVLNRAGARCLVQCKRWVSYLVGVDAIRSFAGTLMGSGLTGSGGIFVTLSDFTGAARAEATRLGMTLLDNRDLYARIERVRRAEPCPTCHSAMRLDRSLHGWWFRCTTPGCGGKRDLGKDPARAVELLTEVSVNEGRKGTP